MAQETKSLGKKDILDRFFTKEEVAKKCLDSIPNLNKYDCIIEPSAGEGSFSSQIDNCFAYDILPAKEGIEQQDWFSLDKKYFNKYQNILVVGNPPFGQQNTLAIQFFNEAAKFANTIAFIFPLSFKKDSVQNQLDLNFSLVKEIALDKNSFILNQKDYSVPCVFQIWQKQEKKRSKKRLKTTTTLFDFTSKENADFRIQRVGGNAGKASFDLDRSSQSNYFIKNKTSLSNEDFVKLINNSCFPTIEFTVGPKSLSKGELIAVLEEQFGE